MKNLKLYAFTILSLIIVNACTSQTFCAQLDENFSKVPNSNNTSDTASCSSRSRSSSTASLSEQIVIQNQDLSTAVRNPLHPQLQPAYQINPEDNAPQSCWRSGACLFLISISLIWFLDNSPVGKTKMSPLQNNTGSKYPTSSPSSFNITGANGANPYAPSKRTLQLSHGNLRGSDSAQ